MAWLSDPSLFRDAVQAASPDEYKDQGVSDVPSDDLQRLVESQVVERVDLRSLPFVRGGKRMPCGRQFSVVELIKRRRRAIFHPSFVNAAIKLYYPEKDFSLPTIPEQQAQLCAVSTDANAHGAMKAVCFDMKASFYQFLLDPSVRDFFVFRANGGYYRYRVLPMGFTKSCVVVHRVLEMVARAAMCQLPPEADASMTVYIDNVRFLVRDNFAAVLRDRFQELCTRFGITLNKEQLNNPHDEGEFLSQAYAVSTATSSMSSKAKSKLKEAFEDLEGSDLRWSECQSRFGRLFWATDVLNIDWAPFYHLLKFYRIACIREKEDRLRGADRVNIWASAHDELKRLKEKVLGNRPVSVRILPETPEITLFTDSSDNAYGAVLVRSDSPSHETICRPWTPQELSSARATDGRRIMVILEARALHLALHKFASTIADRDVRIVIDNASALGALRKGKSPAYVLNSEVQRIRALLGGASGWDVDWICSAGNPADEPSRLRQTIPEKIEKYMANCRRSGVVFRGFTGTRSED
jgi:hypothetical protein